MSWEGKRWEGGKINKKKGAEQNEKGWRPGRGKVAEDSVQGSRERQETWKVRSSWGRSHRRESRTGVHWEQQDSFVVPSWQPRRCCVFVPPRLVKLQATSAFCQISIALISHAEPSPHAVFHPILSLCDNERLGLTRGWVSEQIELGRWRRCGRRGCFVFTSQFDSWCLYVSLSLHLLQMSTHNGWCSVPRDAEPAAVHFDLFNCYALKCQWVWSVVAKNKT